MNIMELHVCPAVKHSPSVEHGCAIVHGPAWQAVDTPAAPPSMAQQIWPAVVQSDFIMHASPPPESPAPLLVPELVPLLFPELVPLLAPLLVPLLLLSVAASFVLEPLGVLSPQAATVAPVKQEIPKKIIMFFIDYTSLPSPSSVRAVHLPVQRAKVPSLIRHGGYYFFLGSESN
jgi:hypothetical protein